MRYPHIEPEPRYTEPYTCYQCGRTAEFGEPREAALHDWRFLNIHVGDGIVCFCPDCDLDSWKRDSEYAADEMIEVCYV